MDLTRYIAMDCEMVRVGKNWRQDALARVSLVNEHGVVVYDKFVKPKRPVTDYRTHVSGVRKTNLKNGESFETVQREVLDILRGRILVGHGLDCDFGVLNITHPEDDIRDTSFYFERVNNGRTPSLKWLARKYLDIDIQQGEHSSAEDARAAMKIYKTKAAQWERDIA